jgi:hypothetical protein
MVSYHGLVLAYRKTVPRRLRHAIIFAIQLVVLLFFAIAVLILVEQLTLVHILNWETIVSFGAVELLALALGKLFGIGEESEEQKRYRRLRLASMRMMLVPRYGHLLVVRTEVEETMPEYPESQYFVVNRDTKFAYRADPFIYDLVQDGIIAEQIYKTDTELQAYLDKNGYKLNPRLPEGSELLSTHMRP